MSVSVLKCWKVWTDRKWKFNWKALVSAATSCCKKLLHSYLLTAVCQQKLQKLGCYDHAAHTLAMDSFSSQTHLQPLTASPDHCSPGTVKVGNMFWQLTLHSSVSEREREIRERNCFNRHAFHNTCTVCFVYDKCTYILYRMSSCIRKYSFVWISDPCQQFSTVVRSKLCNKVWVFCDDYTVDLAIFRWKLVNFWGSNDQLEVQKTCFHDFS